MLSQAQKKQVNMVKKLATRGEAGLFFATLILAILIISQKIWKYIKGPVLRVCTCACLFCLFFVNTSFVPVSKPVKQEDTLEYYSELEESMDFELDEEMSEEIFDEHFGETEVSSDEDMASLNDLIAGQAGAIASDSQSLVDDVQAAAFDKTSWNLILVNKQHPIPEDYEFSLGTIKGSMKCDERIIEPLTSMFAAAADDGVNLIVCSPYRDMSRQEYLFERKMKMYMNTGSSYIDAYREASAVVTVPGASEHQIGLSLDIICDTYSQLNEGFGETEAGKWLMDNAYKYGFILRYPEGKEDITGIIYEPWHYRYVGIEAASLIHDNELTLEEFIESL